MGKKYMSKVYLEDMTLSQLVELPVREREEVLNSLGKERRIKLFNKTKTLSKLLGIRKGKAELAKKNSLYNHLIKHPKGRFWEQAEYKYYFYNDYESLDDCLVSCKGDVVWLNRITGELNVYSSLDLDAETSEKNVLKCIKLGIKGVNVFVNRLVCSTFMPYPKRSNPADLNIIQKNKNINDNSWNNLKWDIYSEPRLEGGGYLTEIIEGPFKGKKFFFRDSKFSKLGISKTEILSVLAGFSKSTQGCVITKISWRDIDRSEMSSFKELVKHLKEFKRFEQLGKWKSSKETSTSSNFVGGIVDTFN